MAPLVILEGEKLPELAKLLNTEQEAAILDIKFRTEKEVADYLRMNRDNLDSLLKLLNDAKEIKEKFKTDQTLSPIAQDLYSYIHNSLNYGLQTIKNFTLRESYISKIQEHVKNIIIALDKPSIKDNDSNVKCLAEEVAQYNNCIMKYATMYRSPASLSYSRWVKDRGMKFSDLVKRCQVMRGYPGVFNNLDNEEKLVIYNDIIQASGRGEVIVNNISKISGQAGTMVLIFIAATMVWDIFSYKHVVPERTRDDVEKAVASRGGATIGEVVKAASKSLVGIEASTSFVMVTAIVNSIEGTFVVGDFVGWLIDFILNSGDTVPYRTGDYRCYVTPLPDGEVLARRIEFR